MRTFIRFAVLAAVAAASGPASAQLTGPSSSQSAYILPTAPGAVTTSLLTVGDSVNGYRFVGAPDGIGAYDNGNGTITVLINHELTTGSGIVRAHGTTGAFVSQFVVNTATRQVTAGSDLITSVVGAGGLPPFGRFCSSDLPDPSAFFNPASGLGTTQRIYMTGEENGTEGRAYGTVATGPGAGTAYFLPHLGRFNWENAVASPTAQNKTVVIGTDDSSPGQVYVYVGTKNNTGATPVDRAGLTNGNLFGIAVNGVANEDGSPTRPANIVSGTRFSLPTFGNVSATTGAQLQTNSVTAGVTQFLRPEDGAWDPTNANRFYFVTTDRFNQAGQVGRSRLYSLTFDSIATPETGGQIHMLLDGTEGQQMMDNITVTANGRVIIQEDPGGNAHLSRVLEYTPGTDSLRVLAAHDPNRFLTGGAGFLTTNEEATGVLDVTRLFDPTGTSGLNYYLMNSMAHYATTTELVEGGQLLLVTVPVPEPAGIGLAATSIVAITYLRRRRARLI